MAGISDFVQENWTEPYYQGQATAFIITLISPFKGKILTQIKKLPKFSLKSTKLDELATATNGEELIQIANRLDNLFSHYPRLKDMPEGFRTELASKNWGEGVLETLDEDLEVTRLSQVLGDEPSNLDSWWILADAKDKVPPAIRQNPDELAFVRRYADENPNANIADEITEARGYGKWKDAIDISKEIDRIKQIRITNKPERLQELGFDPDVDKYRPREAEVAFEIEEQYGYFKRYQRQAPTDPKGDWISFETGKTYDHFGLPDNAKIVDNNANLPKQRAKYFKNLDKHFVEADFVVLDIDAAKAHNPKFHDEIMEHITNTHGTDKLVQYSKIGRTWWDDLPPGLKVDIDDTSSDLAKLFSETSAEERRTLIASWNKMLDLNADEMIRKNPKALESLSKPKGSRPEPNTYLESGYIATHLSKFDEGALRFTSRKAFEKYGTLGPDGGFILPKSELDRLLKETGGDLREIERKLGLGEGYLVGDDTMIVLIEKSDLSNLRMPSGNEGGANEFWIPGGKTSGGVSEGVTDFSSKPTFSEITLN